MWDGERAEGGGQDMKVRGQDMTEQEEKAVACGATPALLKTWAIYEKY